MANFLNVKIQIAATAEGGGGGMAQPEVGRTVELSYQQQSTQTRAHIQTDTETMLYFDHSKW